MGDAGAKLQRKKEIKEERENMKKTGNGERKEEG